MTTLAINTSHTPVLGGLAPGKGCGRGHDVSKRDAKIYVGCSGWSYRHWRGAFYPSELSTKGWFSHYAASFATVELNNTFYRLPPQSTFELWAAQAPPGFVFAVKVNRYGTHRLKLRDPERWLPNYVDRVVLLGQTLGPNLVQLPPRWGRDLGRLAEFLSAASALGQTANAQLRWAVEFRDPSWLDESTYHLLTQHDAALCCHDLLADHPWRRTASWAYARFHGPGALSAKYAGDYGPGGLAQQAKVLRQWHDEGCDVYAYFNNDIAGAAPRDASVMAELLGSP